MVRLLFRGLNKYHNKKTVYNGCMYDSKREAAYAQELDLRLRGHDIKAWQRQIRIPIRVQETKICDYIVDFRIEHVNKSIEFVDIKGMQTDVFKLKWKLFKVLYGAPGIIFTIQK